MKNKYIDLIDQTFDFPQDEFMVADGNLLFNDIDLMDIIEKYGTPLKITYLPKISSQIQRAKRLFKVAMAKADYQGEYHYSYCTKSSQFAFVVHEALKNDIHLETSSAYDLDLIQALERDGSVKKEDLYIICNGFKRPQYIQNIAKLRKDGWKNIIPVLDNKNEFEDLADLIDEDTMMGIRMPPRKSPTSTSIPPAWASVTATLSSSTRTRWPSIPTFA